MKSKRLESLDILRGADMFLLTTFGPIVTMLAHGNRSGILYQFHHVQWEGFVLWDLIMPLFMFMSGVTIPFSMAKYRSGDAPKSQALLRIARRFAALWILGMIAQGNLLKFDLSVLRLYSNTLQTIAVGYAACALMFLYCPRPKVHVSAGVILLLAYWAAMMFVKFDGYGGGDFTPDGNLCEGIDRAVLGRFRDGATLMADGSVRFSSHYRYTWLLSSLTFIVTVLMGMLSGELLKSGRAHRSAILFGIGAACAAAGWLWGFQMPVIKKIWTSSMTLVAGGYSMMLLAGCHWLIDVKDKGHKALGWLRIYGCNAILAYMIMELGWIFRPEGWSGEAVTLCNIGIIIAVLLLCWWKKIFIRV